MARRTVRRIFDIGLRSPIDLRYRGRESTETPAGEFPDVWTVEINVKPLLRIVVIAALAAALPAVGPFTAQCLLRDGAPFFTEINARFGGGLPLGIRAGVDSPRLLLARAAGLDVEIPPLGGYQLGLYASRFDDAFFYTEAERERMVSRHL